MAVTMNSIKDLKKELEEEYFNLEKDISKLKMNKESTKEKKELQSLIEQQLTLLEQILDNLVQTPKLYTKFNKLNKEYTKKVGVKNE
jgi:Zn-dependent oligopeptidase